MALLFLVGGDSLAALPGGGLDAASGGVHLFLFGSNVAAGIWAMWLYTAIRPRHGSGPKTVAKAGFAWWVIVSLQSGKWLALVSVSSLKAILVLLAATLPATIVARW